MTSKPQNAQGHTGPFEGINSNSHLLTLLPACGLLNPQALLHLAVVHILPQPTALEIELREFIRFAGCTPLLESHLTASSEPVGARGDHLGPL